MIIMFCMITSCYRLEGVTLDIAVEGYNPNTSKAMTVEQCQCPQPYTGLSCEDCAPGYYRSQTGPYGGYCVPCQCNGHSETCDVVTGICYVSRHCFDIIMTIIIIIIIMFYLSW